MDNYSSRPDQLALALIVATDADAEGVAHAVRRGEDDVSRNEGAAAEVTSALESYRVGIAVPFRLLPANDSRVFMTYWLRWISVGRKRCAP